MATVQFHACPLCDGHGYRYRTSGRTQTATVCPVCEGSGEIITSQPESPAQPEE